MNAMDRVGAFSGAAYFVLANIGNTLLQDFSLPENPTGREILDSYGRLAGDVVRQIGISVELLGLAAGVIFVAYVYTRTRAAGWLAVAALAGGAIAMALKLASATPAITIYLLRDDMTPETAHMLNALSLVFYMRDCSTDR